MSAKTNQGLVEYVLCQVGRPYWYGTYGATASESLYAAKKKQYPTYYTAADFPSQYGKRVHDCSGLIKGYLMSETPESKPVYNKTYDLSANGTRKACKETGDIATLPELPGVLVFYDGHVGVYVGNGKVVEAKGHAYGVVTTDLKKRPWKWWGKHPAIAYTDTEKTKISTEPLKQVTVSLPQLHKGVKSLSAVWTLQRLLSSRGYKGRDGRPLAVDGSFGPATHTAVLAFQTARGLKTDGYVGEQTWHALLNIDPENGDK